ncbi:hypothetical protein BX661DRAFT_168073 [Kickxella alabastrina]|uniref:uncharacterized protein n=1 Tax=Kickxella alabastrina TaxID=61397 RepID=UPI0022211C60|nr:uncharacterized protein BX661DRAFT_168073 [Kickxella alabastrina]KAI7834877.1 hypothetical protein BX661DRAFT_168073 [Kickxella alabastrina]
MAKDSNAQRHDAPNTKSLSVSFHDPKFTNFVNEANVYNNNSSNANQQKQCNTTPQPVTPQRNTPGSTDRRQTMRPTQLTTAAASASAGSNTNLEDNDDDWPDTNFVNIDSQEILDLVLAEEKMFATQQYLASNDGSLSQEFTETRQDPMAGGLHYGQLMTRSVPVTPPVAEPVYISDADTPGRSSAEESAAGSVNSVTERGRQPWHSGGQPAFFNQENQQDMPKSKVNLFPRLAQHIPTVQPPVSSASLYHRPPQPPTHRDSNTRHLALRHQQQRQTGGKGSQVYRAQLPLGPLRANSATSPGAPPSARRQSSYSPQPNTLHRKPTLNQILAGVTSPTSSGLPNTGSNNSGGIANELERLRMENTRIRAESEQLRAQLYTKEGEVKIVRENLAKTEIDNTHLQERLTNQITSSAQIQSQSEAKLRDEIDRLKTELVFQQQEAQVAAISKASITWTGASGAKRPTRNIDSTPGGAAQSSLAHDASSITGTYPSVTDFAAIPTSASTKRSVPEKAMKLRSQPAASSTSSDSARAENTRLLEIMTEIAGQRSNTGFGNLVSLSIALSKAVKRPDSENMDAFHLMVCEMLCYTEASGYEQLVAVLQLLLRAVDTLVEFRSAWLLGTGKNKKYYQRAAQVALAISTALRNSTIATSKMHTNDQNAASCGAAIDHYCKLLLQIIAVPGALEAVGNEAWTACNPCVLGQYLSAGLHMTGLRGILELVATLVKESPVIWNHLRRQPEEFEVFLLATMGRLQLAFATNDQLMLDGERGFLVLVASAMMNPEEDSATLINGMQKFTRAMVLWFLDEHQALVGQARSVGSDIERRAQVFCQYVICLKVVLSEVADVVELLDGDYSPTFFAFVAACTRMTVGESAFAENASIRELAADLLAYVVTEDQAMSIQSL